MVARQGEFNRPIVQCLVTFLSSDNGGRTAPPLIDGCRYRPLLQLEDASKPDLFGAIFVTVPSKIEFGVEARVELFPVTWPNTAFDALQPGVLFLIREGEKIVGRGCVQGLGVPTEIIYHAGGTQTWDGEHVTHEEILARIRGQDQKESDSK